VTVILDSGGLTALAGQRAKLAEMRRRGLWPAQVPSVVLTEALTGDHRNDFMTNRILRACQVRDVGELMARTAARMRTATGRAGSISAVDAVVAAHAVSNPESFVLTSDPEDLTALAETVPQRIRVVRV
jgi:predicted nucleic acid-binding protein